MPARKKLDPLTLALMANKFVGILVLSGKGDSKIELANERAEHLFGLTSDELKKSTLADLVTFHQSDNSPASLLNASADSIVRGHLATGDEDIIPVDIHALKTEDGSRIVITVVDARDRESYNQLKQQFLKRVTSDLRSPLTAISGALAILKSGRLAKLGDSLKNVVVIAERNTLRLTLMVNNLLDFERYESGNFMIQERRSNLKELVDSAIEMTSVFGYERSVTIMNQVQDIDVSADQQRLPQALANLIVSAVSSSAIGAEICVQSSVEDGWADLRVVFTPQPESSSPQDDSADWSTASLGAMSMEICRKIISLHRGTLTEEESAYWIRLPLCT